MKNIVITSTGLFLLDRLIKLLVMFTMTVNSSINLIPDFFSITYVHNYGAAFSILEGNRFFLILFAVAVLTCLYLFFIKGKNINKIDKILYSALIAGILGNLFDRIFYGYVIDYLSFNIFNYSFPIFNLADILIVISVIILVLKSFKEVNHE